MEQMIEQFEEIGFSKNEAKTYIALLKTPAMNGYEISKKSGVPRSMVYAIIGKLIAKSAIIELRTEPPTYTAIPPKELVSHRRKQTEQTFTSLEKSLQKIEKPAVVNAIKHVEGRKEVIEAMKTLMGAAQEEIWLSAWDEELEELKSTALAQNKKSIELYAMLFTNQQIHSFGNTFYHRRDPTTIDQTKVNTRLTIVIQDHQEVIIAGFIEGQIPQALQTTEPLLILLAKEYIRHDMMIKVVNNRLGDDMMNSLWQKDALLHYIVHNVKK